MATIDPAISTVAMATLDITVKAGDTFSLLLKFFDDDAGTVPTDLTNYVFKMDIKPKTTPLGSPKLSLVQSVGITIGGADNNEMTLLEKISIKGGSYVYDIEGLLPDGSIVTFVGGAFTVVQDVTNSTTEK
jgi:hypothetical protein